MWKEVKAVYGETRSWTKGLGEVEMITYHQADTSDPYHYCDIKKEDTTLRLFDIRMIEDL